jgi:hypothetical protein
MAELYNEEGDPVEALTPEEAAAKAAEAAEAAKAEVKAEYEKTLADKEAELAKAKDKEANFNNLRTKTQTQEEKEAENKAKIEALEKEIAASKDSGKNFVLDTMKERAIKQMSGGDVELEKKLRTNYEVIQRPTESEDQVLARVRDAYLLSVEPVSSTDGGGNFAPTSTSRRVGNDTTGDAFSPELKGFAAEKFGLSEDDIKNFSK